MLGVVPRRSRNKLRFTTAAYFLFLLLPVSACFGQEMSEVQLKTLYNDHQWFALRDAIEQTKAPLFYRGVTEAALNQVKSAQKHLNTVIKIAPHSSDAYEARRALATLYFRNGLYREAFLQIDAMRKERPFAEDVRNMFPFFRELSGVDQSTHGRNASTIRMRMEDGNLYLPFTINGKKTEYALDSGANFSVMSESEAARLGLTVRTADTQMGDSSGAHLAVRIAVAGDVLIGGLHLRNVAFGVLPDTQEPFVDLPQGKRGLLGIPVLIAMQTVRWSPDGTFTFGFPAAQKDHAKANLSFDEAFPVTQVFFQHKPLEFTLDTGAQVTVLSPSFAKEFPDLLKLSGQKESHKLTGVGGSSTYDSILLPSLTLEVGGRNLTLKPAHVLMKQSSDTSGWAAGNLGIDLLNQAHIITIDFHTMTLVLQ